MKNRWWEVGQTTAEYALVLLAAAAVVTVLITWVTGNDALTRFFDEVIRRALHGVPG